MQLGNTTFLKFRMEFIMKRQQTIILLLIIAIGLCDFLILRSQKNINQAPFYTDLGGDAMRIPLVKPYEIVKIDREKVGWWTLGWSMNLHVLPSEKEIYYYSAIHDIKKIAIEDEIILIYTNYQQEIDKDVGQKVLNWFVIVPAQNIETGFDREAEFLNYIQTYGIQKPNWIEPDVAYKQFVKTRCLEWIPNCK